jgi:hypothetical protein
MNIIETIRNKQFWWGDVIYNLALTFILITVFAYVLFSYKIYLYNGQIDDVNKRISSYGTPEQKEYEKEIFAAKKKIDDFSSIIGDHKISSNILSFVQDHTISNVWFSNFDMSQTTDDLKLSVQAQNIDAVSKQILVFEQEDTYVKKVSLSGVSKSVDGGVSFSLDLLLEPKIFNNYTNLDSAVLSPQSVSPNK